MVSHVLKINPTYPKQVREEEEELGTRVVGFSLKRAHSRSSEPILAQASPLSLKRAHSRSSENLTWLKHHIDEELNINVDSASERLKWLANGPSIHVISYSGYLINGFTFYTENKIIKAKCKIVV
ncbi:hypothetical protein Lal_00042974 [Lupinus albus]|nr:hypothetical protein Lal_00042974 [Lupinus albus]